MAIEDLVRQVDHQIGAGKLPPPLDKTQNIVAGACDENTGIDKLNIASTNAVPRALCIQTQDNEKRVVRITA
ncbi:MAG: hypothetical protein NWE87_03455 [Candidatus Bathyarchaeota archaeon]|nr:hypothetical protein [Candidatus Bathyarchaeota archaeon]